MDDSIVTGGKRKRKDDGSEPAAKKQKIGILVPEECADFPREAILKVLRPFFESPCEKSFLLDILEFISCDHCKRKNEEKFLEMCSECLDKSYCRNGASDGIRKKNHREENNQFYFELKMIPMNHGKIAHADFARYTIISDNVLFCNFCQK